MNSNEIVEDMFKYHPWNPEKVQRGDVVRDVLSQAYKSILNVVPDCPDRDNVVPDCPDRDAALRKLREARMDCNSAITHDGKY